MNFASYLPVFRVLARKHMKNHRTDSNHSAIAGALRRAGAGVCDLSAVGSGCPDLLCSWAGITFLIEVKSLDGRGLRFTPAQREFAGRWKGKIYVATNVEQALTILGAIDESTDQPA